MLIKSDYDVFIILLLFLYLFLITPTSSFGSDSRSNVVYLRFFFYFFMMLIIYFKCYVFRFKLFNITYGKGVTTDSYVIALLMFYVLFFYCFTFMLCFLYCFNQLICRFYDQYFILLYSFQFTFIHSSCRCILAQFFLLECLRCSTLIFLIA